MTMAFVRTPLQDWASLTHYVSAAMWESLLSPSVAQSQKLNTLLTHFVTLGLRWPSESSIKVLASLYILCAENHTQAFQMSPHMKYETFRAVKSSLRWHIDKNAHPVLTCVKLPAETDAFRTDFKPLWDLAFGPDSSGWPVPSQVAFVDLHRVMVDMPMRSSNFGTREMVLPRRSTHQAELIPQTSHVMQQLQQQMAQFQNITLAAMQHFGAGNFPGLQLQFPSATPPPDAPNFLALAAPANQHRTIQRLQSRIEAVTPQPVTEPQPLPLIESQPQGLGNLVQERSTEKKGLHATSEPHSQKSVSQVAASLQQSFEQQALAKKTEKALKNKKEKKKKKSGKKLTEGVKKKQPKAAKELTLPTLLQQKRPCVGHESSRSQYMGRTGLAGPGQTKAFKYTDRKGSRELAKQEADRWLVEIMTARGFK